MRLRRVNLTKDNTLGRISNTMRNKVITFKVSPEEYRIITHFFRRYGDRSRALREAVLEKAKVEEERKKKITAKLFKALEALPYSKEEADRIIEEGRKDDYFG